MASIFKKLISRELGENTYNKYFFECQKSLQNKVFDSMAIYNDIYEKLQNKDSITIKKMQRRLNDSMFIALRISKTYFFSFLFFVGAVFYILTKGIHPLVTIASIILMCILFLAKTYEFIINKYCFIDAHIVWIYKTVLDRILVINDKNNLD